MWAPFNIFVYSLYRFHLIHLYLRFKYAIRMTFSLFSDLVDSLLLGICSILDLCSIFSFLGVLILSRIFAKRNVLCKKTIGKNFATIHSACTQACLMWTASQTVPTKSRFWRFALSVNVQLPVPNTLIRSTTRSYFSVRLAPVPASDTHAIRRILFDYNENEITTSWL